MGGGVPPITALHHAERRSSPRKPPFRNAATAARCALSPKAELHMLIYADAQVGNVSPINGLGAGGGWQIDSEANY